MEKKQYLTPIVKVEVMCVKQTLLDGTVIKIDGNGDIDYGGGSSGGARTKERGTWGNLWEADNEYTYEDEDNDEE